MLTPSMPVVSVATTKPGGTRERAAASTSELLGSHSLGTVKPTTAPMTRATRKPTGPGASDLAIWLSFTVAVPSHRSPAPVARIARSARCIGRSH